MSWFKSIEIDPTKGDPDGKRYKIHLWGYYPDNATKGKKKGECIGSVSRETCKMSFEVAKKEAGEMWKNWVKEFPGSMVEVWIHEVDELTPKVGPKDAVMYENNFKHFRPGTKQSEGTPF